MDAARAEVTGRVDGISGRAAERHADGHDEGRHREGAEAAHADRGGVLLRREHQDDEDQQPGAHELAKEVACAVGDGGHGAEGAELRVAVRGRVIVILVIQPDQERAAEAAQHLGYDVAEDLAPGEFAGDSQAQGDRRVQVGARIRTGDEYAAHHGEAPGEGDDDPAAALALGLVEGIAGADAVAEQDQHHRAEPLEYTFHEESHISCCLRFGK